MFHYDNGPDYTHNGLIRIIENKKFGYASAATWKVVIKPQFDFALPFMNGVAKVSMECAVQEDGEHSVWISDRWYFIDKTGKKVGKSKYTKEL